MKASPEFLRRNVKHARAVWGAMPTSAVDSLRELTRRFALCVSEGHLQFLNGHWYITHSGLLRIAGDRRCLGISTSVQESLSTPSTNRWVFKATVYKMPLFDRIRRLSAMLIPPTCLFPVRGAEMRVAETRAVNRALRKAYGIGLCSVEELGSHPLPIRHRAREQSGLSFQWQRLCQRPAQTAGQALPPNSKVRSRSQPGETLRG